MRAIHAIHVTATRKLVRVIHFAIHFTIHFASHKITKTVDHVGRQRTPIILISRVQSAGLVMEVSLKKLSKAQEGTLRPSLFH